MATSSVAVPLGPLVRVRPPDEPYDPSAVPPHPHDIAVPAPHAIPMPAVAAPRVSIVVPVHGKPQFGLRCLDSLRRASGTTPFEVVVVDDASPDATGEILARVPNVAVWRTPANVGYLRAVNLGAALARGEYLCLLNNDVEVTDGWLDALVATLDEDDAAALAGAQLRYPDGYVQEAGGIVWRDGSGHNYGRRDAPHHGHYGFAREVDYCSAAALLVRRSFWDEVGGFDERYAPAYYEDTDLAFAARARGYRVVYQPAAVVYHHEGVSHGVDDTRGIKRYQRLNRARFVAKWGTALAAQHPPGTSPVRARRRGDRPRVLVVDERLPRPDRDSGRLRTWQVVRSLLRNGADVTLVSLDPAPADHWARWLATRGVEVLPGGAPDLPRFLPGLDPALVLLFRPSAMAAYLMHVRRLCPRAFVAYDTVDLHHVRLARERAVTGDGALLATERCLEILETAFTRAADVTIALSEAERRVLAARVPGADVRVLSNVNDPQPPGPGFADRAGVLFVGNHEHPPNRDAALFLAGEVMPLVWAADPDVPLVLAGAAPPPEVRALAGPRVTVHDWLPDLGPLYRAARVVAAPLRYGAGVKGKVTEALSYGVPVVATPVGIEGTRAVPGVSAMAGTTAAELAGAILLLHRDRARWLDVAAAARRGPAAYCSPAAADAVIAGLLADATAAAAATATDPAADASPPRAADGPGRAHAGAA